MYIGEEALYSIYLRHPQIRIDSREVTEGDFFVALKGSQADGNVYAEGALAAGAAYVLVDDPGVVVANDERYLLVPDSLAALQGLARERRRRDKMPVLAITGSNGKTTTKELIAAVMARRYRVHMTPGNYNNHLGLPLTVLATPPETEMTVLEMGANHQREIAMLCELGRPTHGLVTNIGDAHLEGFGGRAGIIAGKGELYDYLAATGGVAFVNDDEDHLRDMADGNRRIIYYKQTEKLEAANPAISVRLLNLHPAIEVAFLNESGDSVTVTVQLSGRHNFQNVKTAIAVGKYFKVRASEIARALEAYRSDNHRSQVLNHRGVSFYWDAYNANPSSVEAALSGFSADHTPNDSVVILGEMLELGEASPAAHRRVALRAGQVARTVVLVGEAMRSVASEFERPWFADSSELARWFWTMDWSGKTVFVKGSRGNKLERLIE